jgi:hypothetical protein
MMCSTMCTSIRSQDIGWVVRYALERVVNYIPEVPGAGVRYTCSFSRPARTEKSSAGTRCLDCAAGFGMVFIRCGLKALSSMNAARPSADSAQQPKNGGSCCLINRQHDGADLAARPCRHLAADAARQEGHKDGGKALTTLELDVAYGANAAPIWCRPCIRGLVRLPAMANKKVVLIHVQAPVCQPARSRVDVSNQFVYQNLAVCRQLAVVHRTPMASMRAGRCLPAIVAETLAKLLG